MNLFGEVTTVDLQTVPEVAIVVQILRHDIREQEGVVHRLLAVLIGIKTKVIGGVGGCASGLKK